MIDGYQPGCENNELPTPPEGAKSGEYDPMRERIKEDHAELEDKGFVIVPNKKDPIKAITDERGKNYGKPIDHFACCQKLYDDWEERYQAGESFCSGMENPETIRALKHGVHWILDKLARAAENPMHKDNWDDIEGYARCIKDALGLEEK